MRHRFSLLEPPVAERSASEILDEWMREETPDQRPARATYSRGDRAFGALVVALVSGFVTWFGIKTGGGALVLAGVCGLAVVAFSGAVSSLWSRYEDLLARIDHAGEAALGGSPMDPGGVGDRGHLASHLRIGPMVSHGGHRYAVVPQLLAGGQWRRPVRRYAAIGPFPFTSISPRSSNA